ncbi:DNA methyltransferase [Streptomyces sp. NPDC005322]|uniref:class I SAM-dependent DNA methyltransferase n=1 Tax=Streptomyces sp. NPDC005322 TaxID=3157032 RepID=UPI0033BB2630
MTDELLSRAEQHLFQQLFIRDLHWSAPDHKPVSLTTEDGRRVTAANISSYKGLRVWVCEGRPGSQVEAELDRLIAKTSTDRLVIFYDNEEQVWRWPVRRNKDNAVTSRLTTHRHRNGHKNPKFAARLNAIKLPSDSVLDSNSVLAKVRLAFDVETQNETKHASKLMARMYAAAEKSYSGGFSNKRRDHEISVTLARILFLMFGDDTEMWTPDAFRNLILRGTKSDGSNLAGKLNDLFAFLNTAAPDLVPESFSGFRYVNGGIFEEPISLPELNKEFRDAILDACSVDWSTISPAIFGSMFQSVRDAKTRRELGEHYTSEENILKTLNPLFLDELRAAFNEAMARDTDQKKINSLNSLWKRLGEIRFMDPACGCGNFIIIAYRELRDLELRVMEALVDLNQSAGQFTLGGDLVKVLRVTLDHFYGIEIDEWPARIAETAMYLMDRQCDLKLRDKFGDAPERLPIQRQATIVVGSALEIDWSTVCAPSDSVVVAGNPPFLGDHTRTRTQLAELQRAWGGDKTLSRLDYVTGWHAKALNYFKSANGLWAFVTTNSITQGDPVPRLFGEIFHAGWEIKFAHRTFPWTSEATGGAAVHCVITGFSRGRPMRPRLFDYLTWGAEPRARAVGSINAYLFDGPNVLVEKHNQPLHGGLPQASKGSEPADAGHLLVGVEEYDEVVADPIAARYLRPFRGARELLWNGDRWCLWLENVTRDEIANSPVLRRRVEAVRQVREESRSEIVKQSAATPHLFRIRKQPASAYVCIPGHVSEARDYYPVARYSADVICGNANFLAPDPDGLLFALISSSMFLTWQKTVGGRIKSDLRFGSTLTWNTLPLPAMNPELRHNIVQAGKVVEDARNLHPERSLGEQYDPGAMDAPLVRAHESLDALVDKAFGAVPFADESERRKILFERYQELTSGLLAHVRGGRGRRR